MTRLYSIILLVSVYVFSFKSIQGKQNAVPVPIHESIRSTDKKLSISAKGNHQFYNVKGRFAVRKTIFDDQPLLNQVVKKASTVYFTFFKKSVRFRHPIVTISKIYTSFSFPSCIYIFNVLYPKHVFW